MAEGQREYGHRESPLGSTYFYRIKATTSRWSWWVSVIDRSAPRPADSAAAKWPRLDLAFGEFGGWHVLGLKRAHRNAQRFIEKQVRRDERQAALSGSFEHPQESLDTNSHTH